MKKITRRKKLLFISLLIVITIITAAAVNFTVKPVIGDSMLPLIKNGDKLVYSKLFYGLRINNLYVLRWRKIKVNDIVIFDDPEDSRKTLVKRCFAVSGQEIFINDNFITVDNYTFEANLEMTEYFKKFTEVPNHYIMVLGDNSGHSVDTRLFGFIHIDDIKGKIIYISRKNRNYDNR